MKDKSKPKVVSMTSPRGVFKYPKLNEPDTKFNPAGDYSVKLVLAGKAAADLIDALQPHYDAAVALAEEQFAALPVANRRRLKEITFNPFYTPVFDEETEQETGEVEFNFKMLASGTRKSDGKPWSRKPVIFDAAGRRMANPPAIWGGTEGKVAFQVGSYFIPGTGAAGISLRLSAVQILELVSSGGGTAAQFGFGEEEGYTHEDEVEAEAPTEATADSFDVDEDVDF